MSKKKIEKVNIPVTLNFEYCECGCHCHEAKGFSIYNDLHGNFTARKGHGQHGQNLGIVRSFDDAKELCEVQFKKDLMALAEE